jgi:hypothetical protein
MAHGDGLRHRQGRQHVPPECFATVGSPMAAVTRLLALLAAGGPAARAQSS